MKMIASFFLNLCKRIFGGDGNIAIGGTVNDKRSTDDHSQETNVGRDQIIGNSGPVSTGSGDQINVQVKGDKNTVIGKQKGT
jgi:hypothetical protein